MKIRIVTLFCFLVTVVAGFAQDNDMLWAKIIDVKNSLAKDNYAHADSIMDEIELQCLDSDRDSIKVLFCESKAQSLVFNKKNYSSAIDYLKATISLYERLNIKSINYLEAFQATAFCYQMAGDNDNAERYYRKALIKSVIADNPKAFRSTAYQNLGSFTKRK